MTQKLWYKSSAAAEMGDRGHNRHGPNRWGAAVPLSRRAGTPSNTIWPGPRSISVPSGVFIHSVIWSQRTVDKNWGLCPFREGEAGSPSNKVAWAEAYLHTKWHLDASSRLATIKMGRKLGLLPHFWGGKLVPHLAQCGLDQGPPPCQVPS